MVRAASTVTGHDDGPHPYAPVEHVVIEGDPAFDSMSVPDAPGPTLLTYTLASSFHRYSTALFVHDGHFLSVRSTRPGGRSSQYQFDLRFTDPTPIRRRTTSWRWLGSTVCLALVGALAGSLGTVLDGSLPGLHWIIAALASIACAASLVVTCRRTTESLALHSNHGRVALVELVAGVGRTCGATGFVAELGRHIQSARLARPRERRQELRDEMREHHRLHSIGVLTDSEYAASKAKILAAH